MKPGITVLTFLLTPLLLASQGEGTDSIRLNDLGYFAARGLDVLVFSNRYNDLFSDSKISGIEIIHHGVRTATNGDVRLRPTPEQWDSIPQLLERRVDRQAGTIEALLRYPAYGFGYRLRAEARGDGIAVSVILDRPLPPGLEGKAGFNLEFLPSAYFTKAYLMDGRSGCFPLHPGGPQRRTKGQAPVERLADGLLLVVDGNADGKAQDRDRVDCDRREILERDCAAMHHRLHLGLLRVHLWNSA